MIIRRLRIRQFYSFFVFAAALAVMTSNLTSRLYMSDVGNWDAQHYYTMAATTDLIPVEAPFAYRWLPHKLVALIPFPAKRVYEFLTLVFLLAGSVFWMRVMLAVGLDRFRATVVVVLVFLWGHWGGHFYIWYRAATEPLAYLLLGAGFLATERRNLVGVAAIGFIGAMCREHTLLLFPYYFLRHASAENLIRIVAATAVSALPASAVYVWIRMITPVTDTFRLRGVVQSGPHNFLDAVEFWLSVKLGSLGGLLEIAASLLMHSGFLVPLLFFFSESRRALLQPHILFWISSCILVGIAVGAGTDRLMYYAFGAEMIALSIALKALPLPQNPRQWLFWGMVVLAQVVLSQAFTNQLAPANVRPVWNLQNLAVWTILVMIAFHWAQFPKRRLTQPRKE